MSVKVWFPIVLTFVLSVLLCACTESSSNRDGSGRGFLGFEASDCKRDIGQARLRAGEAEDVSGADFDSSRYDGLNCIARVEGEGETTFHLLNYRTICVRGWEGNGTVLETGGVELDLIIANCEDESQMLCMCMYDWAISIEGLDPESDVPVYITIVTWGCDLPERGSPNIVMPPASDGFIRCKYANIHSLRETQFETHEPIGLHMPCTLPGEPFNDHYDWTCQEGLVCSDASDGDYRCLAPCETDADCPLPEILACDEGLCMLKESW